MSEVVTTNNKPFDRDQWIKENLIEIKLTNPNNFLIVSETLTRIGMYNRRENELVQICHLLHKKGKYYIVHFKQLFYLDRKLKSKYTYYDKLRTLYIANLLDKWGLVKLVNPKHYILIDDAVDSYTPRDLRLRIVSNSNKKNYKLTTKYSMIYLNKKKANHYERYESVDDYDDEEEYEYYSTNDNVKEESK